MSSPCVEWARTTDPEQPEWMHSGEDHLTHEQAVDSLQHEFSRLSDKWRAETRSLSSMSKRFMHPAYQDIIGLGPDVVPVILRELEQRPNDWFHALQHITRADPNPVPPEHRGNIREMSADWIRWGREHGYLDLFPH